MDNYFKANDPNYTIDSYYLLLDDRLNRCYSYYKEFPYSEEKHFELIEKSLGNSPQDMGWDYISLFLPIKMDYEGDYLGRNQSYIDLYKKNIE